MRKVLSEKILSICCSCTTRMHIWNSRSRSSRSILLSRNSVMVRCQIYCFPSHPHIFHTHTHTTLSSDPSPLFLPGGDIYTGESLLHIAIVNHQEDMVKYLLKKAPKLINIRATGAFFSKGEPCYYGELPLGFAVCVNSQRTVALLLAAGASLDMTDREGNNLLHLCIIHKLKRVGLVCVCVC